MFFLGFLLNLLFFFLNFILSKVKNFFINIFNIKFSIFFLSKAVTKLKGVLNSIKDGVAKVLNIYIYKLWNMIYILSGKLNGMVLSFFTGYRVTSFKNVVNLLQLTITSSNFIFFLIDSGSSANSCPGNSNNSNNGNNGDGFNSKNINPAHAIAISTIQKLLEAGVQVGSMALVAGVFMVVFCGIGALLAGNSNDENNNVDNPNNNQPSSYNSVNPRNEPPIYEDDENRNLPPYDVNNPEQELTNQEALRQVWDEAREQARLRAPKYREIDNPPHYTPPGDDGNVD